MTTGYEFVAEDRFRAACKQFSSSLPEKRRRCVAPQWLGNCSDSISVATSVSHATDVTLKRGPKLVSAPAITVVGGGATSVDSMAV